VGKIFLTAEAGDEVGTVVADGQLGDEDQQLLTVAEDLFTEFEEVGELFAGVGCLLFQRLGSVIEVGFQRGEGGSVVGGRLFDEQFYFGFKRFDRFMQGTLPVGLP